MDTKNTNEKLNYYFTFDYLPSSNKSKLFIDKLFFELNLNKGKKRDLSQANLAKKYHSFSLLVSTLLSKTRFNKNKYCYRSLMKGKFTGEEVSYRHFKSFTSSLIESGYLLHEKGRYHEDEDADFFLTEEEKKQSKKQFIYYSASKYFMSDKLIQLCRDNGLDENNLKHEFLQLRPTTFIEARYPSKRLKSQIIYGNKATKAEVYKIPKAHTLQDTMNEINDFLFSQRFEGAVFNGLKRIFADFTDDDSYDFNKGGRIYAFGENNYQRLKKAERKQIKINGERVCEIDIHASFLTILHGIMDKPIPNRNNLYEITDFPQLVVKAWLNNSITIGHPIVRWPSKTIEELNKELPTYQIPTAPKVGKEILKHYPFINDLDAAGIDWKTLHYIESKIILKAMTELKRQGIPSYPVHDSLIVSERFEKECLETTCYSFEETVGKTPLLKSK